MPLPHSQPAFNSSSCEMLAQRDSGLWCRERQKSVRVGQGLSPAAGLQLPAARSQAIAGSRSHNQSRLRSWSECLGRCRMSVNYCRAERKLSAKQPTKELDVDGYMRRSAAFVYPKIRCHQTLMGLTGSAGFTDADRGPFVEPKT